MVCASVWLYTSGTQLGHDDDAWHRAGSVESLGRVKGARSRRILIAMALRVGTWAG